MYLTWNAVSGAASYNILRGTKTGGPYTTVATGVASSAYTDSGLTNGTTYFYVVQAVNKNGTSGNSNEASIAPVAAIIGNGTVSVNFVGGNGTVVPTPLASTDTAGVLQSANWNNETGANGMASGLTDSAGAATSAIVTWSGSPNTWASGIGEATPDYRLMEGYLDTNDPTTTNVTISGLSPSKYYLIYLYSAGDSAGRSGIYSSGTQSFAMATAPFAGTYTQGTSTNPLATTVGNYVVFQVTGQASYTVTATPNDGAGGGGGFRAPINGVQFVVVTPPAAPANLTAAGLDNSVYLSWTAVPLATSYNVLRRVGTTGAFTTIATGVLATNYTDATAVNGTTYNYAVQAVNAAATSANSNIVSATPIAAVVGNGNGLSGAYYSGAAVDFSAQTTGTLVFANIAPVINYNVGNTTGYNPGPFPAGVPAANFTAVWSGQVLAPYTGSYQFRTITDDGARLTVNGVVQFDDETGHGPLANTGAAITLTAGTKYDIKFEYFQGGGGATAQLLYAPLGSPFQIIPQSQLFTTFTTAPAAPTNLTATGHNHSVALHWNAALNSASFTVKRSLTAGGPYTTIATGVTGAVYTDTGLTNGATYYYVVSATNNIGASPNSNEAAGTASGAFHPVAYWRFEEGSGMAGTAVSPGTLVPDSTGNNNTLQTPDADAAPTYAASVVGNPSNPFATNTSSLDFSAAPGLNLNTAQAYAARFLDTTGAAGDINTRTFNQFTIEASFNLNALGNPQTIVGKDGSFLPDQNSTLYFQVNGGVLSIRAHQADGTFATLNGTTPILAGQWYNGAAVSDGNTLSLYLQSTPTGPYHLEGVTGFVGKLLDGQGLPFSVGRGFFNNNQTDRVVGLIDEVRISDSALDATQFLFSPSLGAMVTGTITLEGVSDLTAVSPVAPLGLFRVSFRDVSSGAEVYADSVPVYGIAGSPTGTGAITVSGVPAGNYNVVIKGAKNLAVQASSVVTVSATGGTIPLVNLPAGDSNNDNSVDSSDFGTLIGAFNTDGSIPGSGYDPTVDFNFDGLVDSSDFGLLIGEFNNTGAI